MNEILSVIKDNSNSLEYRDGFGAYEVKTLLAKKNIIGIDEDEIELLMLESNDLKEIEEGYFVYKGEKPPEVCPICEHPSAYFELSQEDF